MASPDDIADQIDEAVGEAFSEFQDAELLTIGHVALDLILLRTKQGLDADRKPFVPYSQSYTEKRAKIGRSTTTVDLAVTGHMQQAATVVTGNGEASIEFMNPREEMKAAAHDSGVDNPSVSVRSHTRGSVYVDNKTGRRVSRAEAAKDRKRKNKRVTTRTENVSAHTRHQRLPQRNWFDVRHPDEVAVIEEAIGDTVQGRFEKVVK